MDCKNCGKELAEKSKYCHFCGAEVVNERMTFKKLWSDFASKFLGWDNKFFFTIWYLLKQPNIVFEEYLSGVRKKYVAPFAFLAIATALSVLVFTQFEKQYVDMAKSINETQMEFINEQVELDSVQIQSLEKERIETNQRTVEIQKGILKYYNIYTFLLIPFYALISYWVFGKPYNYTEHLIINSYLQGFVFLVSILFFLLSIWVHSSLYGFTLLAILIYYSYTYKKLYNYGYGKVIVKFLKFLGIMIGVFVALILLVVLYKLAEHFLFGG